LNIGEGEKEFEVGETGNEQTIEENIFEIESDPGENDHEVVIVSENRCSRKRVSFIKLPNNCKIKKIKIYSDAEIHSSIGKRKNYKEFWNAEAKYLCKKHPEFKRAKIIKFIEEKWKREETEKYLDISSEHESPAVKKNHARIEDLENKIKSTQDNSGDLNKEEQKEKLRFLEVGLKRAKDALRKNLARLDYFVYKYILIKLGQFQD